MTLEELMRGAGMMIGMIMGFAVLASGEALAREQLRIVGSSTV
jgi:hypothetical protein